MIRFALAAAVMSAGLLAPPAPTQAQAPAAAASLEWFHGEWDGTLDFIGRPATGKLVVRPALSGTATEMVFTADVAATGDKSAFRFEGKGLYRVKPDGKVTGAWSDSYGNFHLLKGKAKAGELRVNWGDAMSEIGHSSYVLSADGKLTVTDGALSNGVFQVFGTGTYRRKP